MPKVSEQYKIHKRALIMESAFQCFAAKGYQTTTIDDIAKQSDIGKGVIYDYFRSKEEILLEIMEEQRIQFITELELLMERTSDPLAKLQILLDKFKAPLRDENAAKFRVLMNFWIHCSNEPDLKPLMQKRYETFRQFIAELLKIGQKSGVFRESVDPQVVSSLLWAIRDGALLHYLINNDNQLNREIWAQSEEMLLKLLCGKP